MSVEEIRLRGRLLSRDEALLRLHMALVGKRVLTEDEFWAPRAALLRAQTAADAQSRGASLPAALLGTAGLAAHASATASLATAEQKIVLTPEAVAAMLAASPALRQAHDELVAGGDMDEKTFWTHCASSRFFRPGRPRAEGNPVDAFFVAAEDATDATNSPSGEASVSPLVDTAATERDRPYDHTTAILARRDTIARRFNAAAVRALSSLAPASSSRAIDDDAIVLPDLVAPPAQALPHLDEARIVERADRAATGDCAPLAADAALRAAVLSLGPPPAVLPQPYVRHIAVPSRQPAQSADDSQANPDHAHLVREAVEVLRHVWRPQGDPARRERLLSHLRALRPAAADASLSSLVAAIDRALSAPC